MIQLVIGILIVVFLLFTGNKLAKAETTNTDTGSKPIYYVKFIDPSPQPLYGIVPIPEPEPQPMYGIEPYPIPIPEPGPQPMYGIEPIPIPEPGPQPMYGIEPIPEPGPQPMYGIEPIPIPEPGPQPMYGVILPPPEPGPQPMYGVEIDFSSQKRAILEKKGKFSHIAKTNNIKVISSLQTGKDEHSSKPDGT